MAVFNPPIPEDTPKDWTNISRPIEQPLADKSKGMLISTLGEGLSDAATLYDRTEKDYLSKKIHTDVNTLQDKWIGDLETARSQQAAGVPTDQQTLATGVQDIPDNVKTGVDRAVQLAQARIQNGGTGKANDTLYAGALYAYTKQLRAENPGYRNYIDEQISKVSGKEPANYYMQNVLQDINTAAGHSRTEQDKDLAFVDKYIDTIPGMDLMRDKYLRGDANGSDLRAFVARKSSLKIQQQEAEAARAQLKSQNELTVTRVKQDFAQEAGQVIDDAWTTQREATNTKTPKEIVDYFQGQATGKTPLLTEDENRQWLTNLALQRESAAQQLRAIALRRDSEGNSYAKSAGGLHNLKDEMDAQVAIYDTVIKAVKDKDYKLVYATLNENTAMVNKSTNMLYKDLTVGEQALRTATVSQAVGPQIGSVLLQDAIVGGMDNKLVQWVTGAKKEMLAQPDPNKTETLIDVFDNARSRKITDPNVYKSLIALPKIIADPAVLPQGKINAAIAAYNPKNLPLLTRFTNPEDRQTAFETMTDRSITKFMATLPANTQQEYRTWAEKSWGGIIAKDDIGELSKIKDRTFLKGYHIGWHTGEGKGDPWFEVLNARGQPLTDAELVYARAVTDPVDKMNRGISHIANIERAVGGDVDSYVVRVLTNSGFDFRNNVDGFPAKMMDAVLNSRRDPNKPKIDSTIKPPVSE